MRKTIILSFDALGDIDSSYFEGLGGFKRLIDQGAYVERVRSVYPSLTYPCHATIVTGRYPRDHGVVNNLLLQPSKEKKDWYWYEKNIRGDSIFRAGKRKGLRVGTILWPVAAKGHNDRIIPEILPHGLLQNQALVALINGTPSSLIRLEKKHGSKRKGLSQPELDDYVEACLHDFILEEDLDLIAAHFIGLDSFKHYYGLKSPKVKEAVESYNQRLINLFKLLEDNKIEANLVVLSDHSHLPVDKAIRLNVFLKEKAYIKTRAGKVFRYKYYMQEAGGSAYIYGKGNTKEDDIRLLKELEEINKGHRIFDKIYTGYQAGKLGADPGCVYMLEAKEGYYFADGLEGDLIIDSPVLKATHGYLPSKENYSAVFFALGPDIKNIKIQEGSLIDIGPTISEMADLGLEGSSGQVWDIFKEEEE